MIVPDTHERAAHGSPFVCRACYRADGLKETLSPSLTGRQAVGKGVTGNGGV